MIDCYCVFIPLQMTENNKKNIFMISFFCQQGCYRGRAFTHPKRKVVGLFLLATNRVKIFIKTSITMQECVVKI